MKTGKKIIVLMVLVFIFSPVFVHAVSWWPLVPCGTSVNPAPCNQCDLFRLLKNIIDFVLIGLMPAIAFGFFVYAGFLILMGGANPGFISQGKTIFWNTAVGIAIISASWLITNTIIRSIAADNVAPEWWKLECRVSVSPTPTPTGTITPTPAPSLSPISISTTTLSDATQNTAYSATVVATGGQTPYTWSISQGTLPAGLTLNASTGVISGTPTAVGTSSFTIKAEDSSSPKQNATKQLSIRVATGPTVTNCGEFDLVCSNNARSCPAIVRDTNVPQGQTSWAYLIPSSARSIPGVDTNKLLEAIMRIETNGRINMQSGSTPPSCGLMQIQAGTANIYRTRCGIDHNITCGWLKGQQAELQQGETIETVARASICIASEYMIATKNSSCYGGQIRDLAAGYNGGAGCDKDNPRGNALALSVSCSQQSTANPKNDLDCSNRPTLRYECLWSNASHTTCNTGFRETRDYAAKFNACYF